MRGLEADFSARSSAPRARARAHPGLPDAASSAAPAKPNLRVDTRRASPAHDAALSEPRRSLQRRGQERPPASVERGEGSSGGGRGQRPPTCDDQHGRRGRTSRRQHQVGPLATGAAPRALTLL